MKNTFFLLIAALFISVASHAQSTSDSIEAKYKLLPMPDSLTLDKTFPVIGTYQLNATNNTTGNVTITLDTANKGIVWIDGLPEGRMKAYLKKSPATYRILAQTTSTGKQIPEGTMIFSPETNTLNISLGAPFNEADPGAIFAQANANPYDMAAENGSSQVKVKTKNATTKTKSKVMYYTATKTMLNSTSTNAAKQ
jgi:hypothetical protein